MISTSLSRYAGAVYLIASLLMVCSYAGAAESAATSTQLLQSRMNQLRDQGSLELQDVVITSKQFLPEFYRQRDYRLAWAAHMDNARALSRRILASYQEGLVPEDYYAAAIQHLLGESSGTGLSPRL